MTHLNNEIGTQHTSLLLYEEVVIWSYLLLYLLQFFLVLDWSA